ncbi:MAG: hypothetical protein ABEJ94_12845 [Halorientalis sp.]
MSVSGPSRFAARLGALLLVASAVALVGPGPAVVRAQETTEGTATTATATDDGARIETAASDGGGGGGLVSGLFGLVGDLIGFLGGIAGAVAGFLDSPVGHALVGIPLGIYLGLKAIALYLEYYE